MPRVTLVKCARKPNPVVTQADIDRAKAGDVGAATYYTWAFRFGGKRYSKTRPRQSQLTQSDFKSSVYSLLEEIEDFASTTQEDLTGAVEGWAERAREIGDEQREKLDNMPEGLQQGATGELLQERADAMEDFASELECIDLTDEDYSAPPEGQTPEECERQEEADWVADKLDEIRSLSPEV